MYYVDKKLKVVSDFHVETTGASAVTLCPTMCEVTYAAIPASGFQTNHRVNQYCAMIGVLGIELIA